MNPVRAAKITCVSAASLRQSVLGALESAGVRETFIQNGKQVCLAERSGPFGLFPRVELEDASGDIFRFYAPQDRAEEVCAAIADSASLSLPGRGSLFVESAEIFAGSARMLPEPPSPSGGVLESAAESLKNFLKPAVAPRLLDYTALTCIVQRGQGAALARTLLEMGLCVPVIAYGQGMGLRNKLGLLRITIPVDKEVIYLLVPAADTDLVESIAVRKARLDRPGQGFIYRSRVRAAVVNTRMSRTKRRHVATMEQVITAVDALQGSTDWRRISAPGRERGSPGAPGPALDCLSLTCDEGRAGDFVRAAMDAGAGGATLLRLGRQDLGREAEERRSTAKISSHARETCDLIVPRDLTERILEAMVERGLFESEVFGMVEITKVEKAITYRG